MPRKKQSSSARWIPVALLFLATAPATWAQTQKDHPYLSYDFSEIRRTGTDQRECLTQIFLSADGNMGYRYREDVFGATTPSVTAVEFANEYHRKVTFEEEATLIQALLAAHVFEVKSDPKSGSADYFGSLNLRINGREMQADFHSPPQSSERKAVHDAFLQFAKRVEIDRPENKEAATTVTEGDLQPVREVKLADILAHPDQYHGKRVSVVGYYHGQFEGSDFAVNQDASKEHAYKRNVWLDRVSAFADKSAIKYRNDAWLRVDGIFLRGPGGHMGLWPGELVRITRLEPVREPKSNSR